MATIAVQSRPTVRERQVAEQLASQQRLAEAFERLRSVYGGRLKTALPGISHQYVSAVLRGEAPCSLVRFVQFLGPLTPAEREYVLGAWLDGAEDAPTKAPLVEVAEASEAVGEAIGHAARILAARTVSPRELVLLRERIRRAQREIGDVAYIARSSR